MTEWLNHRVAITGIGMVTSLGRDASETFRGLVAGTSGIAPSHQSLGLDLAGPVVAAISSFEHAAALQSPNVSASRCDALSYQAMQEAWLHAGLSVEQRVQLFIGETTGASREAIVDYANGAPTDDTPLRRRLVREPLGATARNLMALLPQIVSANVVCSACSSGALAIALGAMRIEQGADVPQLVGGADAISALTLSGFGSLGALAPQACRPFDESRNGLTLGEGAAFLVLESESMAKARGAVILAWLDGYALGAEAHHLTHPEPDGATAAHLIQSAMQRAGFAPEDVGYINAHGTATIPNDAMETQAIKRALGDATCRTLVSSCKGQLGHTLGAAGAIEAAVVVESLRAQQVVPTAGLASVAAECQLSHILGTGRPHAFCCALSSSFGFGGALAVLAFSKAGTLDRRPTRPNVQTKPRIFVRDVVTLGPNGVLLGVGNAALTSAEPSAIAEILPFEPLDRLVMERSRRFDRTTAMTTLAVAELIEHSGASAEKVGLIVGNALGEIDRTVEFIKRVRVRGPRGAQPAEFPHLLASSVSGNASIYAGIKGPAFNVVESGDTAESALDAAVLCLRAHSSKQMICGSVEALTPAITAELSLADESLRSRVAPMCQGAAFLLLDTNGEGTSADIATRSIAPGDVASGNALDGGSGCELVWFGRANTAASAIADLPMPTESSELLWDGENDDATDAVLADSEWLSVRRGTVVARVGGGWHLSATLFAVAAARVLDAQAESVLVVTNPPHGPHLALFRRG